MGRSKKEEMRDGGHWIKGAIKHPGALHKALHVPKGKNISHAKIEKAEHSKNKKVKREAILAETLSHLRKKHHG